MIAVPIPSLMGKMPSLLMRAMMASAGPWPRASLKALYRAPINSPPSVSASSICHFGTSVNEPCLYLKSRSLLSMARGKSEASPFTRRMVELRSWLAGTRCLPSNFNRTAEANRFTSANEAPSRSKTDSRRTVWLPSMRHFVSTGRLRTPSAVVTIRQVPLLAHCICFRPASPWVFAPRKSKETLLRESNLWVKRPLG